MLGFDTSLSIEEIEASFENIDFYEYMMDALRKVSEYEGNQHRCMDGYFMMTN